jgi:hypothetical protein
MYNDALSAAATDTPDATLEFVTRLPAYHRRVLLFVISFMQLFVKEEVVEKTKMTPSNLGKCAGFTVILHPCDDG